MTDPLTAALEAVRLGQWMRTLQKGRSYGTPPEAIAAAEAAFDSAARAALAATPTTQPSPIPAGRLC